jgi:hypothetical protein
MPPALAAEAWTSLMSSLPWVGSEGIFCHLRMEMTRPVMVPRMTSPMGGRRKGIMSAVLRLSLPVESDTLPCVWKLRQERGDE